MNPPGQPAASSLENSADGSAEKTGNEYFNEYSAEERALLLQLAHQAILSALSEQEVSLDPPTPHLAEARGVFTSLYLRNELRGCVGYVLPVKPLYHAVAETARGAAFADSRFAPITRAESPELKIQLSILTVPQPIAADAIEIGRHGLLLTMQSHRGLLLPQVAVEHGWNRVTFLEQTCRKAGLPPDAWQQGAKIEAFMAEIFGDE